MGGGKSTQKPARPTQPAIREPQILPERAGGAAMIAGWGGGELGGPRVCMCVCVRVYVCTCVCMCVYVCTCVPTLLHGRGANVRGAGGRGAGARRRPRVPPPRPPHHLLPGQPGAPPGSAPPRRRHGGPGTPRPRWGGRVKGGGGRGGERGGGVCA